MELDEETLDGHWATNTNTGIDFFIINDAIFSKLCILGDDVEPCFEGAKVSAPEVSKNFSKMDNSFTNTLFSMMKELKFALEGGKSMEENIETVNSEVELSETQPIEETIVEEESETVEEENNDNLNEEEKISENNDNIEQSDLEENENVIEAQEENIVEEENNENSEDNSNIDNEQAYSLLEEKYNELEGKYSLLEKECNDLREFKKNIETQQKESLIDSFYMLTDEDKEDVRNNIEKYSLEDIEAKLSITCVRKKVNFNENNEENKDNLMTYTVKEDCTSTPDWISALRSTKNNRK